MGLKEPFAETRWIHPPKKKWIHCYMSIDEKPTNEPLRPSEILVQGKSNDGDRMFGATEPALERRILTLPSPALVNYDDKRAIEPIRTIPVQGSPMGYQRATKSPDYEDSFSGEELKKRSGNTPSREVHNKLEKNRRAHLKECFETLRKQLPSMEDKKISNQTILKAAYRYIASLKRKEKEFEHEMERLARQKIAYQQQLSSMKKEISARWDHIDLATILSSSLETQKESTTTASEGLDLREEQPLNLSTSTKRTPAVPRNGDWPSTKQQRNHPYGRPEKAASQPVTKIPSTTVLSPKQITSYTTHVVTASPKGVPTPFTSSDGIGIPRISGEAVPLNGIHMPAQLVASNVHLSGPPGTLIGQPTIQVITPDGYKIVPADHAPSGTKPLAITLSHPGGLDHLAEDGKVMLAVSKNGLSTLQLAVPPRSAIQGGQSIQGSSSLGNGSGNTKMTPAASLIPSYLPLTNGITQLVSLVGPIVVSQAQRGVVVSSGATKGGATLPVVVVSASNR